MVNIRVSNETRSHLIRLIENDTTVSKAATALNIPYRTAHRIWIKLQQTGVTNKEKHGGIKGKMLTDAMIEGIRWTIDDDCTLTLEQLQDITEGFCGIRVSKSTIANYIGHFNYTLKRLQVKAIAGDTEELW